MRKIDKEYENPIDNILIDWGKKLSPYFYSSHMTANDITTMSLICGLLSILLFKNNLFVLSGLAIYASYFFDCIDGFYARKYNMVTKLGDLYDHAKDISITMILIILILVPLFKNNFKAFITIIIILLLSLFLALVQLGCQEKIYDLQNSDTLSFTKKLCDTKEPTKLIKFTRYFGTGTFNIILALIIIFYSFIK